MPCTIYFHINTISALILRYLEKFRYRIRDQPFQIADPEILLFSGIKLPCYQLGAYCGGGVCWVCWAPPPYLLLVRSNHAGKR